jgi:hypothetical protein
MKKKVAMLLLIVFSFPLFSMETWPSVPGYPSLKDQAPSYDEPSYQNPQTEGVSVLEAAINDDRGASDAAPLLSIAPAENSNFAVRWGKKFMRTIKKNPLTICGLSLVAVCSTGLATFIWVYNPPAEPMPYQCPPWNWNKTDVGYEPCGFNLIPAGASACQLQFINDSCVPYFRMPFPSAFYNNIHNSIWYERGVRLGLESPMVCGEPEDGSEMLLALCDTEDWDHQQREKLCRAQGKPTDCGFPDQDTSNASHQTCAMPVDDLIDGTTAVFTPVQYHSTLINEQAYEAIAAQPELVESPRCSSILRWMQNNAGKRCPHFPENALPRTHWPVDPEHEQCDDFYEGSDE